MGETKDAKGRWLATGAVGTVVVGFVAMLYASFADGMRAARARLERLGSRVVETECGPIEYATYGEGPPVLMVHGIFGGFDQGLVLARGILGEGLHSIVPTRFGYLRTPMPHGASPASQADAHACLLDALGVERGAVVGTSSGAASAIQFALRHRERCSALVLVSSNAPGEISLTTVPERLIRVVFGAGFVMDFVFWLLSSRFRSSLGALMGVPKEFELSPEEEAQVAEAMETLLPVSERSAGVLLDQYVTNPDMNSGYPLQEIAVPALVIHAVDDSLASYEYVRQLAQEIPNARFVTLEKGGHLLLGQRARVQSEIAQFLGQHSLVRP